MSKTTKFWSYGLTGKFGSRNKRRKLVPNYCEYCGWTLIITKHRIKPGVNGGKYLPGNVIGLCPNCHALSDRNIIPKHVLFEIVQARLRRLNGGQAEQ